MGLAEQRAGAEDATRGDTCVLSPRRPLQRRVAHWAMVLVLVPMLACAVWMGQLAHNALNRSHAATLALMSHTVAASLADDLRVERGTVPEHGTGAHLESLVLDPRIAFVEVTDPAGRSLHRYVIEPGGYDRFNASAKAAPLDVGPPRRLGGADDLMVQRLAIWDPPMSLVHAGESERGRRRLVGFLTLAMRDPGRAAAVRTLTVAQVAAASVVALITLPLVLWGVKRSVQPVETLLGAMARLTRGQQPDPLPEHDHDELGLLGAGFNLMARRLLEARADLERHARDLERTVDQRTAELRAKGRRLEAELRDKDDFLRVVTHDLNAPVRNINGMAAMLLVKHRGQLPPDAQSKLERIVANAKLQAELIGELLELSRIRTRPGRREVVDLDATVRDLVGSFGFDLERAAIDLEIDGPLPTLHVERNRVRQVFQNLIDNAIKYMLDAPTRSIRVGVLSQASLGSVGLPPLPEAMRGAGALAGRVAFYVADTGRGIAEGDLADVFQVFRRAAHSGSHEVAGRGIGLASVKSIVETYGGEVAVWSRLGEGSTFVFTLDTAQVAVEAGAGASRKAA